MKCLTDVGASPTLSNVSSHSAVYCISKKPSLRLSGSATAAAAANFISRKLI